MHTAPLALPRTTTMHRFITHGLAATVALLTAACSATPANENWQSREKLSNGERNALFLDSESAGDLKMFVILDPVQGLTKLKFDLDWEFDGINDEDLDTWELTLKCKSGCPADVSVDFKMDCSLLESGDNMDCDATSPFNDYGYFEFERMPEE